MKRFLSLTLLLVLALCVNAQQRKTWDFTKGISDETLENLVADSNWKVEFNDDGTFKQAVDAVKMSGELEANGVVIEELRGLRLGTSGLSSASNYILGSNKFRMSRKSEQFILRVAPGQTITMKARSANSTATDRGFQGDSNMEYISGPAGGICPGSSIEAEGRDSGGNFTLVWKVNDEIEGLDGDSLDITITTAPAGGLDVALIQIDEGDNPESTSVELAYLYDSSYPNYDADADIAYSLVQATVERVDNLNITPIDIAGDMSGTTRETLEQYNVVVVSSAINSSNPFVGTIKEAIAYTPMLTFSPNLYEAWGYGKATATQTNMLDIPESARSNALFQPTDLVNTPSYIDDNGKLTLLEEGSNEFVTGYTAEEDSYFANDNVLATADGVNAIHIHNSKRNAYLMLPYQFEMTSPNDNIADIIPNAVILLNKTKVEVTKASKPAVNQEFHNKYTTVSLSCTTANHNIYYTIDGSEPTTESTLYSEPFDISDENVVVKAIATADGYNQSDVQEKTVEIYELAGAPEISYTQTGDTVEITITAAEGDEVYYNFIGSTNVAESGLYEEPVKINRHATISAFTAAHGKYLQSELVSMDIKVEGEKVRMDVVSHFDGKTDWSSLKVTTYPFYTEEPIGSETFKDQNGEDSVVIYFQPADELTVYNPGNGWEFKTYGQGGQYQNNTILHNVADFDGYNPQTPWDDSEYEATSGCVQFSSPGKNADNVTDPATACIQSTEAFQGPFDVVTYISGYNSKVKLYVSPDTLNADSWIELGDLHSGSIKGTATNGKDGSTRIWRKTILSYEGTDQVFVKVASGGNTANIFDIYIKNEGELSKEYTGIKDVNKSNDASSTVVRTMVYSINGTLLDKAAKGINIIKEVYADGTVKTRKIMVK